MATHGKVKELTGELIKNLKKLTKPRVELIVLFVLAVSKVGTINLSRIAVAMDSKCTKGGNYRRLQRFVKEIDLCKAGLVCMILKFIGLSESLTLLIDRTNWNFGKKKINILMVSVLYEGYKEAIDPEQVNPAEIINMRKFAEEALKFRRSEEGAQPWAILDVGVWEYQLKFENSKVTAEGETKGQWIDFDKDYTYKYGYYDKVEGSGKYYFNIETKQLLILDDDPMKKPHEYIAKLNNGHMVLMGTKTYKDNAFQAKLINVPHIPAKG